MKVLVTGATGFVGGEIVRHLKATGHSILVLARNPCSRRVQEMVTGCGADVHPGDVLEATSLEGALSGIEAVIHLVGIISEVGESRFERVHIGGTQNMTAAAQRSGVRRFVHMSALGTRSDAVSRYHRSKWVAEEVVRRSGLQFTIFRPSLIYGHRDQFVNLYAKIIRRSPVVPLLGSPHVRFQPVPVEAVATAFVRSLAEPKSVGQTYDLCGAEPLTLAEIVDRILAVLGKRRLKLHVPFVLARCQATILELLFARLLRKAPPLNRDQLVMLQEDNVGNPQPANELFRLQPVPLQEGIAKYLRRET